MVSERSKKWRKLGTRTELPDHFMSFITWREIVGSSNVERVGWDAEQRVMFVLYKHRKPEREGMGPGYAYFDVPFQRAVAAAYATSVGGYINNKIKGHFRPLKIWTD